MAFYSLIFGFQILDLKYHFSASLMVKIKDIPFKSLLQIIFQILSGLYFNTSILSFFDLVGVFELFQTGFRYFHFL